MLDILLYVIVSVVTGLVFATAVAGKKISGVEFLFLCCFFGVFSPPVIFFSLAAANIFSKVNLLISLSALLVGTLVYIYYKPSRYQPAVNAIKQLLVEDRFSLSVIAISIITFAIYFGQPFEFVHSTSMDAANYTVQAAYQAEHNNLLFEDSQKSQYRSFFPKGRYNLNPVSIFAPHFPFPPLNRIFLATAMLFTFKLAFYVHLLLAIVTFMAMSVIARACFKSRIVQMFTPVIGIAYPIYILYAALPMSEMLMLAISTSALALSYIGYNRRNPILMVCGGFVCAMLFGIRAEAILYFGPWAVFCVLYILTEKDDEKRLMVKYALFSSSLFAWFFLLPSLKSGGPYMTHNLGSIGFVQQCYIAGCLLLSLLFLFFERYLSLPLKSLFSIINSKKLCWTIGIALSIVLFVLFYLRYWLPTDMIRELRDINYFYSKLLTDYPTNFLISYTSYYLINTAFLGAGIALGSRKVVLYPVIFIFLPASLMTIMHVYHSPTQHWLLRRYLICLYPLMIFCSAFLFDWLLSLINDLKYRKTLCVVLALLWIYPHASYAYEANRRKQPNDRDETVGLYDAFKSHAGQFKPGQDVIIVSGNAHKAEAYQLGMRYFFHIESLTPRLETITDDELKRFVKAKQDLGQNVFIVGLEQEEEQRLDSIGLLERVRKDNFPALKESVLYRLQYSN